MSKIEQIVDGYKISINVDIFSVEKVEEKKPEPKAEPKPETVKLYCVKSHMPGEYLTKGKLYDVIDGTITFDDGYQYKLVEDSSFALGDGAKIVGNLCFPLVKRPAKVGEWVIATTKDGHSADINKPYRVTYIHDNMCKDWVSVDDCINSIKHYVFKDCQYLVLDGYHGDPEEEKRAEEIARLEKEREEHNAAKDRERADYNKEVDAKIKELKEKK